MINLDEIMKHGTTITSSGTTGEPKKYFQTPEKIGPANAVSIEVNKLTPESKVYTCCRLTHAGGLLAQTVPALSIGAEVDIVKFNPYDFVKVIRNYTHSHLAPDHARAIMGTKGFDKLNLSGITIMCGSDRVTWDIIEAFVKKGCTFIVNWGMSEIGPVAINHTFTSLDEVERIKKLCPTNCTILGSNKYCEYIVDETLWVSGDICIYDDWYNTKDIVEEVEGVLFYRGRAHSE